MTDVLYQRVRDALYEFIPTINNVEKKMVSSSQPVVSSDIGEVETRAELLHSIFG
jgi:hypothetical protein